MDTYEVNVKPTGVNPKYRIMALVCFAALYFLLRFGWSILFPTSNEMRRGLASVAMETGIVGLLVGLGMVCLKPYRFVSCRLLVDEESMVVMTEYTGWVGRIVRKLTVRKNRVRTIFEIKTTEFHPGGVGISERGRFGSRMLGFIFLSKELPEYDALRQLVEGWRAPARL